MYEHIILYYLKLAADERDDRQFSSVADRYARLAWSYHLVQCGGNDNRHRGPYVQPYC